MLTIVLVHGAFADASSWKGVVERLQKEGHTVVAPANPRVLGSGRHRRQGVGHRHRAHDGAARGR
jgi:pimeloyl-ACP methyl ester carboxylesterase